MEPLAAIIVFGLLMSSIALIGGLTCILNETRLQRLVLPLVAIAAGTLVGGGIFHLLPEAIAHYHNELPAYLWFIAGFLTFYLLEQVLHWHHCHRSLSQHTRPLTHLLLIADGVHNLIGGLAVGASFMVDFHLGLTAWFVAAAHEVPQELGDFGVLVHGGWSRGRALLFNFLSGLTFLVGGLIAYYGSHSFDVHFLLAFAAGNFVYIGAVDLIPEIKSHPRPAQNFLHALYFSVGLLFLLIVRLQFTHSH